MASKACVSLLRQRFFHVSRAVQFKSVGNPLGKGRLINASGYSCRPISTWHHLNQAARNSYGFNRIESDDTENMYDVNDDDLDDLRRQHRKETHSQHKSSEGKQFRDFSLNAELLTSLENLGYKEPFEIQSKSLSHTLEGRDVIARAVTGSGKTLAFSVPIVHKLAQSTGKHRRNPRAIVISPTRELCQQILRSIQELDPRLRCVALYGGAAIRPQTAQLLRGVDVICATPGRLNDHFEKQNFKLSDVEFLCLDEADELLTPNFKQQIEDVLESCPQSKQMMLFSATMPPHIRRLTQAFMTDPVVIDITQNQQYKAPSSVEHLCMRVPNSQHLSVVKKLLNERKPERCIVFMETKAKTSQAAMQLRRMNVKCEAINSDLSQSRRENIMAAFRKGAIEVLVATDVAARGLDVPEVDLVVQVSVPRNGTEYYVHRSGRTGRAGRQGVAVLLHSGYPDQMQIIREIQRVVKLQHVSAPDFSELQEEEGAKMLKSLERVSEKDIKTMLPVMDSVDFSDTSNTRTLLAAALSLLARGHQPAYEKQPTYVRNNNHTYQRRDSSYVSNNRMYQRDQRRQTSRGLLFEDEDDYSTERRQSDDDDVAIANHFRQR